ncbi:beta-ketoacyl synthase N-terminal-like domain-containing protein, partial [Thermodesulfobacteriota bacterium]
AGYFVENHMGKTAEATGFSPGDAGKEKSPVAAVSEQFVPLDRPRFLQTDVFSDKARVVKDEEIAIIGLSGRYPMAEDLAAFWENLKTGKDCITEIPKERWDYQKYFDPDRDKIGKIYSKWGGFINDVDKFDPLFFNISPREARLMDPQERLFLETVWATLEDAGYTGNGLRKFHVGVFAGMMWGQYQLFGTDESLLKSGSVPGSSQASIANRVSYYFNFQGPSIGLDTMCSSSLTAIHLACESIRRGECELAIAGGVNLSIHPNKYFQLAQGKFFSSDGRCRSFGEGGDGYVPGEGVGALFLKPLGRAKAEGDHIYAVIKGSTINHGGKTNGYTVPNPNAQKALIVEALKRAGVDPRTVSYVEAHGTGTSLGDPIEIAGLTRAYREYTTDKQYCSIGSVKSNIGHLEAAAGIVGLTKVLLQMQYQQLVPTIHSKKLNPNINFKDSPFYVQRELMEWNQPVIQENGTEKRYPRRATISSFGAGGANAHVVVEEYEDPVSQSLTENQGPQLFVLSAKNEERLKVYAGKIKDFLEKTFVQSRETEQETQVKSIQRDLIKIACDILEVDESDIDSDTDLREYGFDPINLGAFCRKVNETYHLKINTAVFSEYPSVDDFSRYLGSAYKDILAPYYPERKVDQPEISFNLADIAYTLQTGREAMGSRLAIVVHGMDDLIEKLGLYCRGSKDIADLYTGDVKKESQQIEPLISGSAGELFINAVIDERDLNKLARLWISGAKIDWELFYIEDRPNRISLPTYPFAKESYWVPKTSNAEYGENKCLHPLVDRVVPNPGHGAVFEKNLQQTDPIVRDHQIWGTPVLPGTGYLEMVYAACSQISDIREMSISQMYWLSPLEVEADEKTVHIIVAKEDDGFECRLESTTQNNSVTHARCTIQSDETFIENSDMYVPVEEIQSRCVEIIEKEAFYERFRKAGIVYGPYFQVVSRIWVDEEECLGLVRLPEAYAPELKDYTLHPALTDGVLQAVSGLMQDASPLMLPFCLEKVEIYHPLTSSSAYAHIRGNGNDRFDVMILNEAGRVCCKFYDFTLRKAKDPLSRFFYFPEWVPFQHRDAASRVGESLPAQQKGAADKQSEMTTVLVVYPSASDPDIETFSRSLVNVQAADGVYEIRLGKTDKQHAPNVREIRAKDPTAIGNLVEELPEPDTIYFLSGVYEPVKDDPDILAQSQEEGVLSL